MSGILIQLGLPTADTIVHNSHVLFASHCLIAVMQSLCIERSVDYRKNVHYKFFYIYLSYQIVQWFANIAAW